MSGKRAFSPAEMIKGVTNSKDSRASRPGCMTPREDDEHAQDIVDWGVYRALLSDQGFDTSGLDRGHHCALAFGCSVK